MTLETNPIAGIGHNSQTDPVAHDVEGVAGDRLKSFIERIERLNEELAATREDVKEVFAEAKGNGFDVKTMREIIKLRKMDKDDRDERDALIEVYQRALGMVLDFGEAA